MVGQPLLVFLGVRLASVFLIQTWFVPDEYWQATEIAHHMVFGYGYQTWEWMEGIRGVFYPATLASLFKLLSLIRADYRFLLIHLPRIFHAVAFAVGDYHTWKLSKTLYGKASSCWVTVCLTTAWFLQYCAPRTLTSSMETVLLAVAFCYYPWGKEKECLSSSYLWLVGLACAVRPTAVIPFVPLALRHLWRSHCRRRLLLKYITITVVVLALTVGLDSWYYGRLVVVPWRFAHFNAVTGLSSHYGTQPWHWYLSQGLPAVLTTHLLPFLLAALTQPARHKPLLTVCVWSVLVYSCLSHKEFRFLLPILPLCLCVAGDYITFYVISHAKKSEDSIKHRSIVIFLLLLVPNLLLGLYLGLVHQRGPLDAVEALQGEVEANTQADILFLMPCHSTPFYSHFHRNISMRFLTCEPNLKGKKNYKDEADLFEEDPLAWLQQEYTQPLGQKEDKPTSYDTGGNAVVHYPSLSLPSHILMFSVLKERISIFLEDHDYQLCQQVFHSQVKDGRRSQHILIYSQHCS